MNKKYILVAMLLSVANTYAQEHKESEIEEVVISSQTIFLGKKENEKVSSHLYLGKKELKKYNYNDPNKILMGRNGVSIVEEDGFGLRPNIIIRGASSYRSSSINLMEDGILAAPAPYISPAAYYFPTIGRMAGIEILKSSGQILYGPNTVGGSMNLVSTQIPKTFAGNATLSYGSFDTKNIHLNVGDKIGKFGYLVEFYNGSSNGFKKLSNGENTGYNLNDGIVKLLYDNSNAVIPNKLQFKLQFSGQKDHETYMGIHKADFNKDPYQRYLSSELDHMKNSHRQYLLSYEIKPLKGLNLNFDAYRNEFKRNWHKVNDIQVGTASKVGLSSALGKDINSNEIAVLKGKYDGDNTVYIRNNNRAYVSQGLQVNGSYHITRNGKLRFGARYHSEKEDRFQWDDTYKSTSYGLSLKKEGTPGTQDNRIGTANATASYVQYQHTIGKFTLTGGLRYENIEMKQKNFGTKDTERTGAALKETTHRAEALIPGASVLFNYAKWGSVFASLHRGFAPPGITQNTKPEFSWNYEAGARWHTNHIDAEVTAYVNDYSNILGADTNAVGGSINNQGNLYNAGEVLVKGLELYAKYTIGGKDNSINFPISLNYTFFDSAFKKDFKSVTYGDTKKGDQLPFIPKHMLTGEMNANINNLSIGAIVKYRSEIRNKVGQGNIAEKDLVPSILLFDAVVRYQISPKANIFVTGQNLLNKKYLTSLNPAGYRPGMPRFFSVGVNFKL